MKKYAKPELEVLNVSFEDIIQTSGLINGGQNGSVEGDNSGIINGGGSGIFSLRDENADF